VENFSSLYDTGKARTFPIILVRHGKAVPPEHWDGPDSTRPLLHKGLLQAQDIAGGLLAFGPELIVSSPATRCLATMEPLREMSGALVKISQSISQEEYQSRGTRAIAAMEKRLAKRTPTVMCSHGPVFPQLVSAAAQAGHADKGQWETAASLGVGSFSVIHFSRETDTPHIVAVETHEAPKRKT